MENKKQLHKKFLIEKFQLIKKNLEMNYFKIPYFGKSSYKFKSMIKKEFENYSINVKPVLINTKLIRYFSLKERCSQLYSSNILYKFTCPKTKDISDIGKLRRQFFKMDRLTQI